MKWIWQHKEYPRFKYDKNQLQKLIEDIEYYRGLIDGICKLLSQDDIKNIEIDTLEDELINTFLIEGESLKRESVRSSIRKKLDKSFSGISDKNSTAQTDSLTTILIDSNLNHNLLDTKRLHGWHNCLFENGYSGFDKIKVGSFRINDEMKVVSGAIGFERTHYLAPPVALIENDIKQFLDFCNSDDENIYIRSAIAHLWFVIIHPYDDGNGRIARATADSILSQKNMQTQFKPYSISSAINNDRKGYYGILDQTTNLSKNKDFNITPWLIWHLNIFKNALKGTLEKIDLVVRKTKFWDKHRNKNFNSRQIKALSKILDTQDFVGGLNTKKYVSLTKASKATAIRDISLLLHWDCIEKVPNANGRNVRYTIKL